MPRPRFVASSVLVAVTVALSLAVPATPVAAQSADDFVPVTDAMLQDPDAADWPMWRRTLDGWGYSPLDQVMRENVGELRLAWSRALMAGTQEVTPLAYRGVLYMPNGSDVIQAIDAATGDLVWEYRRDLPEDVYEYVGGNARSMRNIAIYDRFIINVSDDDYAYALDATTGEIAWETEIFRLPGEAGRAQLRSDHRRRRGDLRAELPSARRAGVVRGRGPRRAHRRGIVASADGAGPGRAGGRDVGRRALRGAGARRLVDAGQLRSRVEFSAETGETAWVHEQRAATMPLMTTGGGLVFAGDVNGRFKALDQETGEVLWEINLGSPVVGFPISYALGGRQYVAVNTGVGGGTNLRMTPELRPSVGSVLFVFELPGSTGP